MTATADLFQVDTAPDTDDEIPESYFRGYEDGNAGRPYANPYPVNSRDYREYQIGHAHGSVHFPEATLRALSTFPDSKIGTCHTCQRQDCKAPKIKERNPEQGCASWENQSTATGGGE